MRAINALLIILALFAPPKQAGAGDNCNAEKFILAIDTGHSAHKGGAISARGIAEYVFNKEFAETLLKALLRSGFKEAFLINPEGTDLSFQRRTQISESGGAALIISIHHDSVQPHYLMSWNYERKERYYSDKFRGFSIFYSESYDRTGQSLLFAGILGTELLYNNFKPSLHHAEKIAGEGRLLVDMNKGIYRFDTLAVLRTKVPAVLFERGIIVNRKEEEELSTADNKRKMASAIVKAVEKYCESTQERILPIR